MNFFTISERNLLTSNGWSVGDRTAIKNYRKIVKRDVDAYEVQSLIQSDCDNNDYYEFDREEKTLAAAMLGIDIL